MKKLLLILTTAAAAFSMQARELTFWYGDQKIVPGSSIEFAEGEVSDLGGAPQLKYAPNLAISSDIYTSKLKVTAKCTSGHSIQMCCGGQCSSGTTVTKDGVKVQTGQHLSLDFDCVIFPFIGDAPKVVTEFEAQDGTYTDTKITFVLTMDGLKASIGAVENDNPVLVTSAGLYYNLPEGGAIELFSITGNSALRTNAVGSGLLDTSSLARGIYIYSVTARGVNRTGKIMVK